MRPSVCTTCRLQLCLHTRLKLLQLQRRGVADFQPHERSQAHNAETDHRARGSDPPHVQVPRDVLYRSRDSQRAVGDAGSLKERRGNGADIRPRPPRPQSGVPEPQAIERNMIDAALTSGLQAPETDSSVDAATADIMKPLTASIDPQMAKYVGTRIRRLRQADQTQDTFSAERVKDEVLAYSAENERSPLPDVMFEQLMLTHLSLRNPRTAVEVWNHFIRSGRQPTAKTYTIMLRGSLYVRDVAGMESFWIKMRKAGVQPDVHAWSALIFGFMRSGRIDAGFQALNQMGQEWLAAARAKLKPARGQPRKKMDRDEQATSPEQVLSAFGNIDDTPKPDVAVMNAAISGLAASKDHEIPKVLKWARPFGVEPDMRTYNALLGIAMRYNQIEEATRILDRMRKSGIEPDSTTWTILLNQLFISGEIEKLSPQEQQDRVLGFITSLDTVTAAGIDEKGYALAVDRLLKRYSNAAAASAVIQHMVDRGKTPNTHMYTILMASYFQREPPDFEAVEALWAQIRSRGPFDSVFYDRMIEAYATHHQTVGMRPMLEFMELMQSQGKRPSWRALECVTRALAERQEWNRIKRIVEEVRGWFGDAPGEMHSGLRDFGQRSFWSFIISTGLTREGLTSADLARPRRTGTLMDGAA